MIPALFGLAWCLLRSHGGPFLSSLGVKVLAFSSILSSLCESIMGASRGLANLLLKYQHTLSLQQVLVTYKPKSRTSRRYRSYRMALGVPVNLLEDRLGAMVLRTNRALGRCHSQLLGPVSPAIPVDLVEGGWRSVVVPGPISMRDGMFSHGSPLLEGTFTSNKGIFTLSHDVLTPCVVEYIIGVAILPCVVVASDLVFAAHATTHLEKCIEWCRLETVG